MKLSESQVRSIVKEELKNVISEMKHLMPQDAKEIAGGAGLAAIGLSPFALAQFLQANPHLMEKVQAFLQSLMQEE